MLKKLLRAFDLEQRMLAKMEWLPAVLFVMMCIIVWFVRGTHFGGDSSNYIESAEGLLEGKELAFWTTSYLGYILFVALHKFFGLGELNIIISQVVLSALVAVALYDLGRRLAGEGAGIIAASLYAVNVDLARFTFAILSDSLFTSVIFLTTYATYRASKSWDGWLVVSLLLIVVTGLIRASGWVLMPCFLLFLLLTRIRLLRLKHYLMGGVFLAFSMLGIVHYLDWYSKGEILNNFIKMGEVVLGESQCIRKGLIKGDQSFILDMPSDTDESGDQLSLIRYCTLYTGSCVLLFGSRVIASFAHTRFFYSTRHNLVIGVAFTVLYLLAAIGFVRYLREPFTWLIVGIIVCHMTVVGYFGADWDGRFVLHIFPLITMYSGIGTVVFWKRCKSAVRKHESML